jgi:hypothetical protein
MAVNCEKIVKIVLKNLSKIMDVDYEKIKAASKKGLKMAKTYDEELLGIMEALMDLPNVESEEELADFDIQVLQVYCKVKDIDDSGSERQIRERVWDALEAEMDDGSDDSDYSDSESESESESDQESESEPEPEERRSRSRKVKELPVVIEEVPSEPVKEKKVKEKKQPAAEPQVIIQ